MWKYIKFIVHGVSLMREINCNCINQQLILHYTRGEYTVCIQRSLNELPQYIAELLVDKCFVSNLKMYLLDKSSYSLEELIND